MEDEEFKDTEFTTVVGNRIPLYVSITSNLVEDPKFFCKNNPPDLVAFFIEVSENFAAQCKVHKKMKLMQVETTIPSKLANFFEIQNQLRTHTYYGL